MKRNGVDIKRRCDSSVIGNIELFNVRKLDELKSGVKLPSLMEFRSPFAFADKANDNNRYYYGKTYQSYMKTDEYVARMQRGLVNGMIGHPPGEPDDTKISHVFTRFWVDGNVLWCEGRVCDTLYGRVLYDLYRNDIILGISQRAICDSEVRDGIEYMAPSFYYLEGGDMVSVPAVGCAFPELSFRDSLKDIIPDKDSLDEATHIIESLSSQYSKPSTNSDSFKQFDTDIVSAPTGGVWFKKSVKEDQVGTIKQEIIQDPVSDRLDLAVKLVDDNVSLRTENEILKEKFDSIEILKDRDSFIKTDMKIVLNEVLKSIHKIVSDLSLNQGFLIGKRKVIEARLNDELTSLREDSLSKIGKIVRLENSVSNVKSVVDDLTQKLSKSESRCDIFKSKFESEQKRSIDLSQKLSSVEDSSKDAIDKIKILDVEVYRQKALAKVPISKMKDAERLFRECQSEDEVKVAFDKLMKGCVSTFSAREAVDDAPIKTDSFTKSLIRSAHGRRQQKFK